MSGDDDAIINYILIGLVLFIVLSIGILGLVALSAQDEAQSKPDVEWEVTKLNDSWIRISHAGGDEIPAADLSVAVGGDPRPADWSAKTLSQGEYGIVRVGDGRRITILWQQSYADREVLARWVLSPSE